MMGERAHNNWGDFEEIFNLHHHRVYVLCLRMTGNVTEAGDLTEKVFVQVFRHLQSFPVEAAFSSWLYRLTVNQVLMHFRRNVVGNEQTSKDGELSSNRVNRPAVAECSGGTSKSRLHKARVKMRQLLTRRGTPGKIDDAIGPNPLK